MNPTVLKTLKIVVKVAGIALPIAVNYFDGLDQKKYIQDEVAKAVAEATSKKES